MNNETKRKSISLILIIFIILLVVALVILIAKVFQNNEDDEVSNNSDIEISVNTSTENTTNSTDYDILASENSTENNVITNDTNTDSSTNNTTENTTSTENTTTNTEPKTITLNGHNYKIKDNLEATIIQNNNSSAIQTVYPDYNYKMIFNTSSNTNFADLKSNSDLKTYLESTFNLKITSAIKSGNLNNLNVILFTISDSIGNGYCVFTSLNDNEIAYAKLYDTSDSSKLISDLSTPLANISELIASMEN